MSVADITKRILNSQTNAKTGFRTSSYATDYIYQGKCFSTSQRITATAAANVFVLFDMSAAIAEGKAVSVYTPVMDATTGPITLDYYVGCDYTGGTSFNINNRLYGAPANLCTLTYGATGSSKGVKFTEGFVAAGHKSGAASQEGLEFVPPQSETLNTILVEIDNTNGTDGTLFINFVWFEV